MKQSFKNYIIEHSADGVWTGATEGGVPVVRYKGKRQPAEPFLAELGIKLNKTNKYTVREEDAGMGESYSGGDTPDTGDGVSEIQE